MVQASLSMSIINILYSLEENYDTHINITGFYFISHDN